MEVGSGLQGVLVPIRAQLEGISIHSIGFLGTASYLWFVLGCTSVPTVVRPVGHIRDFSRFAALAAAAVLVHELILSIPV